MMDKASVESVADSTRQAELEKRFHYHTVFCCY